MQRVVINLIALAVAEGAHPKAVQECLGHGSIRITLATYGHLFPALDEALTEGLDDQFQNAISNDARPERTPAICLETPAAAKRLLKQGICLSGWGDLNSRPSVPQFAAPQIADLRKHTETASDLPF